MLAWRSRECKRRSSVLQLNLSDTDSTSQDGSSLELIAAILGRQIFVCISMNHSLTKLHWFPGLSQVV